MNTLHIEKWCKTLTKLSLPLFAVAAIGLGTGGCDRGENAAHAGPGGFPPPMVSVTEAVSRDVPLPRPACGERSDRIADAIRVRGYRSNN